METGKQIIEAMEKHCEEKITCSYRLRFQIEQAIQRIIDEKNSMKTNIENVLSGHERMIKRITQ